MKKKGNVFRCFNTLSKQRGTSIGIFCRTQKWFHSRESANITYQVPGASSFSEGYYVCNASNSAGWTLGRTYLDVKGADGLPSRRPLRYFDSLFQKDPGKTRVITAYISVRNNTKLTDSDAQVMHFQNIIKSSPGATTLGNANCE